MRKNYFVALALFLSVIIVMIGIWYATRRVQNLDVVSPTFQPTIPQFIWELDYFMVDGVVYQPSEKGAQIKFYTADSLKGHDTCNSFWANYHITNASGSITIYDLSQTIVMCHDKVTKVEESGSILEGQYLADALRDVSKFELNDENELKLYYNNSSRVLVFRPSNSPFPFNDLEP